MIALEVLTEPRLTDPNVRYAAAVHLAILDRLHAADLISTHDLDELRMALNIAVEYAANAVAAAWLHERGSIPIPSNGLEATR
jgi:dihydropteroate synthase